MTDFPFASGHHIAWYTTLLLILSLFKMLMFHSLFSSNLFFNIALKYDLF